ncbi:MAG: glycosyltransferase family 2 protein [Acidobacteriia bacterium]|nr:glycosyltransferase family 2 protein [Terriglobia bacterium]
MPTPAISVVVAVWDERDNLRPLLDELVPILDRVGQAFEVILADDGSTDGSSQLLDELAAGDDRLRVLHLARNFGKSAALEAGFHAALGDVIVTLDADLQQDPEDIPILLRQLGPVDAVVGVRTSRHDSRWRRLSSRIGNGIRNLLLNEDVADSACPLKVIRAEAVRQIPMFDGAHRFIPALLRLEGFRIIQAPVRHRPRRAGRSKYGTWDRAFHGLRDVLGVRWMRDRHLDWRVRE